MATVGVKVVTINMKSHTVDILNISSLRAFIHALLSRAYLSISQAFLSCMKLLVIILSENNDNLNANPQLEW